MNIIFYLEKLQIVYYHCFNQTQTLVLISVRCCMSKDVTIKTIISLLQDCEDLELLYLIHGLLIDTDH